MRLIVALATVSAFAQNQPHIRDWKPSPNEGTLQPKDACVSLHRLTGYDLSVISAEVVKATSAVPEFCRVLVQAQPEIRVEVSLPARWNGRLYMFGNGGYAGEDLEAPGRVAHRDIALRAGFVVTQTNTGHDAVREPLATFAVHQQKLLDYAFRSLHVTAETAKRVAETHYGSRPARSYFNGCSTGGRQALVLAQRYPEAFDGIIAGAPGLHHVQLRLRGIATNQALAESPIPVPKLKVLADRIYGKCDALDGLKDGLIDDPRRCAFQPGRDLPVCPAGEAAGCFTGAQIRTLERIYGALTLHGRTAAPGGLVGAEVAGPNGRSGWEGAIVSATGLTQPAQNLESALRYMVFAVPDPTYRITQFNLERDASNLDGVGRLMNALDPDLSRFRDRGGKLLLYFGWADPTLNPLMAIEYHEDVTLRMGASTGDFFRLYMMPGVFHCGGGVGPASFDPLAQVVPWVEQGQAPGSITASQVEAGKVVRTRPLCPYPQVARYSGQGSSDDAASFRCVGAP